jgi:SAM-dependent methyltransferase
VPETRGERKLVTLLFTDLTGYTALAASLDPEEVFAFIRPTLADLQRVVEDHGGTVPQVQGDGFMAVFGVPVAHEDDAERAVRAALAVRERIRELNEGRSGLSITEVHSGVNSGEVMVGPAPEASGIAVVGVDRSSPMLDLAQAKARAQGVSLDLVRADMRALPELGRFPLVTGDAIDQVMMSKIIIYIKIRIECHANRFTELLH